MTTGGIGGHTSFALSNIINNLKDFFTLTKRRQRTFGQPALKTGGGSARELAGNRGI